MQIETLRAEIELRRRVRLYHEIAALKAAAEKMAADPGRARTRTYFKLRSKIKRKQRELLQPVLISLTG